MKIFLTILILTISLNAYTLKEIFFQGKATSVENKDGVYSFDIDGNGIKDFMHIKKDTNQKNKCSLLMKMNNRQEISLNLQEICYFISVYEGAYLSFGESGAYYAQLEFYQYDKKYNNWFFIGSYSEEGIGQNDELNELKIAKEVQLSIDSKIAKVEGKTTLLSLYSSINELFKRNDNFGLSTIPKLIKSVPLQIDDLSSKNLSSYNDIAYYLQQSNSNDEAIFLLEKILEKFPNRTVAYLNLADAYNGVGSKEKAKINYEKYISLMKQDNKEAKIPQRVLEFK